MQQEFVVSDIAFVLKAFLDRYKERIPGLKFVYDENLSYESAVSNYRAKNDMVGELSEALPLFVFSRSVLRWSEHGLMRRSNTLRPKGEVSVSDGSALKFKAVHGEFDLNFQIIVKDMYELENFEISYLAEMNAGADKEVEVMLLPELGAFKYFVQLQPLDDKQINIENVYYKTINGRIVIRGFFFTIYGSGKVIKDINLTVMDMRRSLLY